MKVKLAITYGIIIWIISYLLSLIFNPIFSTIFPKINVTVPLVIIFTTGIFGTLYIRNIETNEVIEGLLVGIIFVIIDILLDTVFFILPNFHTPIFGDFATHIISMTIIMLLITTFLQIGYYLE